MSSSFKQRVIDWGKHGMAVASPLIRAVRPWLDADGLRMSAAMSFYGMLSLAPLLLVLVGVLSWWIDQSYLESNLLAQVSSVVGDRGAEVVRMALSSARNPSEGWFASIAGFVLLLSGASGVFVELQTSLQRLWYAGKEPPKTEKPAWWNMASLRLRGLAYVMAIGFLLLISLVVSTVIKIIATWASAWLPFGSGMLLQLVNELIAFGVAMALFVGMMRIGGPAAPRLRFLWIGAFVGAILFTGGKQALAFYLSTAAVVSAYGAAGSLVVLLMWMYFSAAVLLFAASVARALQEEEEDKLRKKNSSSQAPSTLGETVAS
ncbi:YihY/virulence factor BrkB family protein [Diaphorobacter sp. HDW4A]|uniref:YihY/virulence factor BrkB family protein n=1 Tax=Diaphorobacter sp. HDW4A TaxID=2714924 RepID=UPI00140E1190|nr:YihY/virulence factor BrkB family protein [Diaphorobacter sp. HDW4A]